MSFYVPLKDPSFNSLRVVGMTTLQSGVLSAIIGADSGFTTLTDATTKVGRVGSPHYLNAEEPAAVFVAANFPTDNFLFIGGGSSNFNASTEIRFYTAANSTTLTGSQQMTIDKSGNVLVRTTIPDGVNPLVIGGGITIASGTLIKTTTNFTNGAGSAVGTLNNAPAAGNPTKWIPVNDNGTIRYIPAW